MSQTTKCTGASCPLKRHCNKYAPKLTKSKEVSIIYFSTPPYNHEKKRCREYGS